MTKTKTALLRNVLVGLFVLLALSALGLFLALKTPKLAVPPQTDFMLSNLTLWNPGSSAVPGQTLEVVAGRIADIRPSADGDVSDLCQNCFAMPGLIDAHVHTPPSLAFGNRELFALLYLKHGVTSVRDLGQFDDDFPDFVTRLNTGKLAGPRVYYCGRILDGNPVSVPGAVRVETADAGRDAVRAHAASGVDCIKIYGNISREAFKGIEEESERQGLPLVGHTPHAMSFTNMRNFESQHYTGIPYLTKPAPEDRAYRSHDLIEMTPEDVSQVIATMKANNIAFLPTNANLMSRLTVSDSRRFPPSEGYSHLPEFWQVAWPSIVSHPETDAEIETELAAIPHALDFIKAADFAGVDVLVGTDVIMPYVIPGESMFQQLEIMADALGSHEAALKAATQTNGAHIDPGRVGLISLGAHADFLLFETDPRGDLDRIKQWDYAVVDGRVYRRADVDAALDRFDRHFRGPVYTTLMNAAYTLLASDYEDGEVAGD